MFSRFKVSAIVCKFKKEMIQYRFLVSKHYNIGREQVNKTKQWTISGFTYTFVNNIVQHKLTKHELKVSTF